MGIALPSRFQAISESIAYQGWKAVNGECINRDHTGTTGIFLARREGPDAGLVHAGSCCGVGTGYGVGSNHHFRSWSGWLRHVWLVMLAFAMMADVSSSGQSAPASRKPSDAGCPAPTIAWSCWREAHQGVAQRARMKSK